MPLDDARRAGRNPRSPSRSASPSSLARRPDGQAEPFNAPPPGLVVAEERDPMKRAPPRRSPQSETVSRRRDAGTARRGRSAEMRMAEAQALVLEELPAAALGVDLVRRAGRALPGRRDVPARVPRTVGRRTGASEARSGARASSRSSRASASDRCAATTQAGVGVLAVEPDRRARRALPLAVRVCPRGADPEADAALPHQVRHVELRRPSRP